MIKLFKTDEARMHDGAPFPIDIIYTDGRIVREEYAVDYGNEIGVYANDQCDSSRKYTLSPFDADISEIRWV